MNPKLACALSALFIATTLKVSSCMDMDTDGDLDIVLKADMDGVLWFENTCGEP